MKLENRKKNKEKLMKPKVVSLKRSKLRAFSQTDQGKKKQKQKQDTSDYNKKMKEGTLLPTNKN